jgi:hypothetical protein
MNENSLPVLQTLQREPSRCSQSLFFERFTDEVDAVAVPWYSPADGD